VIIYKKQEHEETEAYSPTSNIASPVTTQDCHENACTPVMITGQPPVTSSAKRQLSLKRFNQAKPSMSGVQVAPKGQTLHFRVRKALRAPAPYNTSP